MNKYRHIGKPQPKGDKTTGTGLEVFFKKAKQAIEDKNTNAINKVYSKMIEEPAVFVVASKNRKKMSTHDKPAYNPPPALKPVFSESSKSKPKIGSKEQERLH